MNEERRRRCFTRTAKDPSFDLSSIMGPASQKLKLRARFWSRSVPPPGFEIPQNLSQQDIEAELQHETETETLFVCPAFNSDHSACGKVFSTKSALLQHLKHELTGNHDTLDLARLLTYTNRCVLRGSDFPNRYQAQRHLQNALSRGICKADRAYMTYQHDLGSNRNSHHYCYLSSTNVSMHMSLFQSKSLSSAHRHQMI